MCHRRKQGEDQGDIGGTAPLILIGRYRCESDRNCSKYKWKNEAEFKEFEPQLKFKPRLKYGWFHLKLYQIF